MADLPQIADAPGVPTIKRDPNTPTTALATRDEFSGYGETQPPVWGVFDSLTGKQVVFADTVMNFGYRREWAVADYPVERGGFESYDKVDLPFDILVSFSAGGDAATRQELLASVDRIAGTLDRYDVVTPEVVYTSVNVRHYDYRRNARNGAGRIQVDIFLLEIRIGAQRDYHNTRFPKSESARRRGTLQTQSPAQSIITKFLPLAR